MFSCMAVFGPLLSDESSNVEECSSSSTNSSLKSLEITGEKLAREGLGFLEISFKFKRKGIASSQYAIWIEDKAGNLVRTVFVTSFTGKGGYAFRKDCLPVWVNKAKLQLRRLEVDAVSGATPPSGKQVYIWDGKDQYGSPAAPGEYRFYLEATLYWSDRVLYRGNFFHGGLPQEDIPVLVSYFGGQRNKDMIQEFKARYVTTQA